MITFYNGKLIYIEGEKQIMKLSEMKTSHIINCLNMINKQCNKEGWKPNTFPIYNNLRNELQKRI